MDGSGARTGMVALGLGAVLVGGGLAVSSTLGGSDDGVDVLDTQRRRTTTDVTVAGTTLERTGNAPAAPDASGEPRSESAAPAGGDEDDGVGCEGLIGMRDPRCTEISVDDPDTVDEDAETGRTTGTTLGGAGQGSPTTGAPPTTNDDADGRGAREAQDEDATTTTRPTTTTTTRPPRTTATTTTTTTRSPATTTTSRPPATTTTEPPPPEEPTTTTEPPPPPEETTTTQPATTTTEPPPQTTTTTTTLVPPVTVPDVDLLP